MDNNREMGCATLLLLFAMLFLLCGSIDGITAQLKRIANHMEQVK